MEKRDQILIDKLEEENCRIIKTNKENYKKE
jgi:hypothetical protein